MEGPGFHHECDPCRHEIAAPQRTESTESSHDSLRWKVVNNDPEKKKKVLHSPDGYYNEGTHYWTIPGTLSRGGYGEAVMCQDLKTDKKFIRKKVTAGNFSPNEVMVPLQFSGIAGTIPGIHGVVFEGEEVTIFQEFAGWSVEKVMHSPCSKKLQDPRTVLVLAFQAFATLDILHMHGVTHRDIKPDNLCVNATGKLWHLKFIDFGSSQKDGDHLTGGLTYEYLSPEICKVATGRIPKEEGRLGPGTDVWAMALSLIYCLCGYHVMVYANTGHTMYQETDPIQRRNKRRECLDKVARFTDEDVAGKLINSSWPKVIRDLLYNTLRVNPVERWTANQAANFTLTVLKGGATQMEQKAALE